MSYEAEKVSRFFPPDFTQIFLQRPMVHCVFEYDNDPISTSRKDGYSTAENMYEALEDEGHDARLYIFSPSDDGTMTGTVLANSNFTPLHKYY